MASSPDHTLSDLNSEFDSIDDEEEQRLAQEEWDESLRQLQQLVSAVLLPFFGKWLGRKWSYWLFARYQRLGLGASFLFGSSLPFASLHRYT